MSNQEVAIPDSIKAMLANSTAASVNNMETGSGGVPRISLKKSKFTAKVGEESTRLGETIQVVILGIDPPVGFAKTWYEHGYTDGSVDAPDCTSDDGIKPSQFISNPQNESCRTCIQNQWGSAKSMSGGKAKACKDSKRLFVKLAKELGDDEAPVYILVVTVMSLRPFGLYGKELANSGIPSPSIVITELGFDDDASVPKLTFKNLGLLTEEHCKTALALGNEKPWDTKIPETAKSNKAISNKQDIDKPIEGEVESDGKPDPTDNW